MEEPMEESKDITKTQARLSRLNGYSWYANHDMSVRFEDVES
jgi:hypothetical protein